MPNVKLFICYNIFKTFQDSRSYIFSYCAHTHARAHAGTHKQRVYLMGFQPVGYFREFRIYLVGFFRYPTRYYLYPTRHIVKNPTSKYTHNPTSYRLTPTTPQAYRVTPTTPQAYVYSPTNPQAKHTHPLPHKHNVTPTTPQACVYSPTTPQTK